MNRLLQLVCITGLALVLAQARVARRHHQRNVSRDSNLSLHITTDKVLSTSPLLRTSGVHPRSPVDVVLTNATTLAARGTLIIPADSTTPFYDRIAQKITASSDADSCTMICGTDFEGEVWEGLAYQTIPTGSNCDTTASCETIRTAVGECADRLHEARAVRGCCRISDGGTWSGQLRLRAEADGWPLADC